ncbi:MAG: hypothetical protein IH987_10165 [Planctomycetes bacterium]|nr:hypothetical protein [Planctomycetota bacterium]
MKSWNSLAAAGCLVAVLLPIGACDRDARLAGRNLRDVTVGTVTHYGATLDKSATPEQVTYVLLRAIRDDFKAKTSEEREAALDKLFDVSAAGHLTQGKASEIDRQETVFKIVNRWTPTVAHYVDDIETDWEKARLRLKISGLQPVTNRTDGTQQCKVITQLADPGGNPNAAVLLSVQLVQDSGYWRVLALQFLNSRRDLNPKAAARGPAKANTASDG